VFPAHSIRPPDCRCSRPANRWPATAHHRNNNNRHATAATMMEFSGFSHLLFFFCVFQNAKRWPPLARRRKYAADTFPLIASIELTDRQRLISSNLSGSFACSRCHLARLFDYEAMKENGSPIGDDHCLAPVDRFVRLESSQFSVCRPRLLKLASQLIY
jgi:hypothetical protein